MSTGIIIQARVGSTRLVNKMIKPFFKGKSILELLIERFKGEVPEEIPFVIATTEKPDDDAIEEMGKRYSVPVFRGDEEDVLRRFIDTANYFDFTKIIRICADNPLLDIEGTLLLNSADQLDDWDYLAYKVAGNKPSITSHLGFWGEWVTLEALEKVNERTKEKFFHEHVTNYIYTYPDLFSVKWKSAPEISLNRQDIRLTVDREEDFKLVAEIYGILQSLGLPLTVENIVQVVDSHPDFLERMARQITLNKK